jgi:DNA repair ATPase RecN
MESIDSGSSTEEQRADVTVVQDLLQPFVDAYSNYLRVVQALWAGDTYPQQAFEAYRTYMQALEEAWRKQAKQAKWVDVYSTYLQELQQIQLEPDVGRKPMDAYRNYLQDLEGLASESQQLQLQLYQTYLQSLRANLGFEDLQRGVVSAEQDYIRGLKDAWNQVDPATMDLSSIWGISQSLMAAAMLTASAREALRGRWMITSRLDAANAPG